MIDFNAIPSAKILVLGDIILDQYKVGRVRRLSPEAPVPLVDIEDEFIRIGGAANVAANIKSLGCSVDLTGFVGDDLNGNLVRDSLDSQGIGLDHLVVTPDIDTTVKTRIVGSNQHIVRYDNESMLADKIDLREILNSQIRSMFERFDYDMVILSDYSKGVISRSTIASLTSVCDPRKVVADIKPKNKEMYSGLYCISPNYWEAKAMVGDLDAEEIAVILQKELDLECVIITMSEAGVLFLDENGELHHTGPHYYQPPLETHHRPDVTGAGDTLISVFAASVASGNDPVCSVKLGNIAASIVVTKVGAAVCTLDELKKEYEDEFSGRD